MKSINKKCNATIVYLSRKQDINDLKKSLILLYRFFIKKYNYPIIIFNDDFTEKDERSVLSINPNIQFEKIEFKIPPWIDKKKPFKTKWSIGYRHMCRFYSGEFYKLDIMKNYDWYWRLDSDSFIHSKIPYDIFKFMEREGYIYGYLGRTLNDGEEVVEGLWNLTKEYIQNNDIKPKFLHKFKDKVGNWDYSMYYTNFEISKLEFWRSDKYMNYYNHLDQNGGIYYHRWGDNVIHLLAISIFLDEKKVHCYKDIDYSHGYFRPNRHFRLYTLVKKYNLQKKLIKYRLYIIKNSKIYDILNKHLISKVVEILNKYINYKKIQDDVYCINYA